MKIFKHNNSQNGFTLVEVMMAMVILGIGIFAVVGLQVRNVGYNTGSKKQTEGYTWAMDQIENLLAIPYNNTILDVQGNTVTVVAGDGHMTTKGPYTVEWDVEDNGHGAGALGNIENSKRVHVSVRWNTQEVAQLDFTRVQSSF